MLLDIVSKSFINIIMIYVIDFVNYMIKRAMPHSTKGKGRLPYKDQNRR